MLVIAEVPHSQSYSVSILRYCRFVPGFLWGLNALWRDDPTTATEWFPPVGDLEARLRGDVHCFGEALKPSNRALSQAHASG